MGKDECGADVRALCGVRSDERKKLKNTPLVARLFRKMIRKAVLNAKPYGKNAATHPQYAVAKEVDFSASKSRFLDALKQAYQSSKNRSNRIMLFWKNVQTGKGLGCLQTSRSPPGNLGCKATAIPSRNIPLVILRFV